MLLYKVSIYIAWYLGKALLLPELLSNSIKHLIHGNCQSAQTRKLKHVEKVSATPLSFEYAENVHSTLVKSSIYPSFDQSVLEIDID